MFDFSRLAYLTQVVTFSGHVSRAISFPGVFAGKPQIVATPGSDMNVNIWVSDVTVSGATINASAPITGDVQVVAAGTKP